MLPKSKPRCWHSFFRQILTTGIYPSAVFWSWPVIKPGSPASLFKWKLCDLLYMPVGSTPTSQVSLSLHDTQRLGLHTKESARHSASYRLERLVIQAGWWWSQFPSQSHRKLFFLNGNEGCVSWYAYLKSLVLTQRAHTADLWSALNLYIVLELYPES